MKSSRATTVTLCLLLLMTSAVSAAELEQDPFADTLLGNVNGQRMALRDAGVDITAEYEGDFLRNANGGIKRGDSYIDDLDLKFALDGEKLFGIEGNKSLIYFLNNDGGKPNERQVGSLQGVDNLEVRKNAPRLYEAWTEQTLFDNTLAVLVGLHDLNTEFLSPDISANFLKPTMQIGQAFAQTGRNGPSIFPNAGLAARVKYMPANALYLSAAVFDGAPGSSGHPYETHVSFAGHNGALLVAEAGYAPAVSNAVDLNNKIAVGAWSYTSRFDDLVDVNSQGLPVQRRQDGVYFLTHYRFYNDKEAGHAISAFFRTELADGDTSEVKWSYETGLVASGWVPTRPDGEIGLGLSQAHASQKYIQSVNGMADSDEYSMEIYYNDSVYRGVHLQPDLQYIVNPGIDTVTKNATVFGIRGDINFLMQDADKNNDL